MVPKVFWDTNILVDYLDDRPFDLAATHLIFKSVEEGSFELFVSESVVCTALYLSALAPASAALSLALFLKVATVLPASNAIIEKAFLSPFKDKEDAILYYLAVAHKMDAFITRNKKDFVPFAIAQTVVLTPKEAATGFF